MSYQSENSNSPKRPTYRSFAHQLRRNLRVQDLVLKDLRKTQKNPWDPTINRDKM